MEGRGAEGAGLEVAGRADVAQLVEHSLGKGEVTGSIPVISSRVWPPRVAAGFERE